MHTCLHTSSSLYKQPFPSERERERKRRRRRQDFARTCIAAPCPCLGEAVAHGGKGRGGEKEDQKGKVPEVWIRRL